MILDVCTLLVFVKSWHTCTHRKKEGPRTSDASEEHYDTPLSSPCGMHCKEGIDRHDATGSTSISSTGMMCNCTVSIAWQQAQRSETTTSHINVQHVHVRCIAVRCAYTMSAQDMVTALRSGSGSRHACTAVGAQQGCYVRCMRARPTHMHATR